MGRGLIRGQPALGLQTLNPPTEVSSVAELIVKCNCVDLNRDFHQKTNVLSEILCQWHISNFCNVFSGTLKALFCFLHPQTQTPQLHHLCPSHIFPRRHVQFISSRAVSNHERPRWATESQPWGQGSGEGQTHLWGTRVPLPHTVHTGECCEPHPDHTAQLVFSKQEAAPTVRTWCGRLPCTHYMVHADVFIEINWTSFFS